MNPKQLEFALNPLSKIGLSEPLLDSYFEWSDKLEELSDIDSAITNYTIDKEDCKGEILIPFIHSAAQTDYLLSFIAHAFRCRGYNPLFISCRGTLPMCFRKKEHPDNDGTCVGCKYKSDRIFDTFGFETVSISEYAGSPETMQIPDSREKILNLEYSGVDVSNLAMASSRKHLRKYNVDLDDKEDNQIYTKYLQSAIYFVEFVNSILDERDIIATIGNHPAYVYGGAILEATAESELPAISFGGGYYREDAILFGNMKNRMGFEQFSDLNTLQKIVEQELDPEEQKEIEYYMQGRRDGSTIREINQYIGSHDKELSLNTHATTGCLFTNLLWDGSLSGSAVTFENPLEWVKETVEYVDGMEDLQLIIKPHPAEAHRETHIKISDWVRSELDVPDNVYLLEPDTSISPYEIMEKIDFSIVYNSTVGLESAYDGVPVITTGDTHYKYLGFTYDPQTPAEYFDLLNDASRLELSENDQSRARRYAHFLLVDRHISIEKLDTINQIHTISHEEIAESNILDDVIEQILENERSIRVNVVG